MDRFVQGEEVPYESLRQVWLNTTQPVREWAFSVYEEFFRAVRTVNASLPREHQLRVLLGDSPIDWDSVYAGDDLRKWLGIGMATPYVSFGGRSWRRAVAP